MSVLGRCPACGSDWCTNCDCLRAQLTEALVEIADRKAKLAYLLDWIDAKGLLPEHRFTFPDGESWEVAPPKPQVQ